MELHFDPTMAMRYGVDGAVLLHSFAFWLQKNAANSRNIQKGRVWTYNTGEALASLFPFWTRRQIQRITGNLKDAGALLIENFGKGMDRTLWYSLSDELMVHYGITPPTIAPNGTMGESIAPNGATDCTEPCNVIERYNNISDPTDAYQLNTSMPTEPEPEQPKEGETPTVEESFTLFWLAYPRKVSKAKALREWKKLRPSWAMVQQILTALSAQKQQSSWRDPQYIPHPSTWLHGRRWEDETIILDADEAPAPSGSCWGEDPEVI